MNSPLQVSESRAESALERSVPEDKNETPALTADQKSPWFLSLDAGLVAFLCLVEILTFAPFLKQIGFYLDDWLMLQTLHFGPQNIASAFANYFFNDPKVIIRPVEVLHFAPMFFLFGLKPLGYHIVNGALEILCVVLLYAAVKNFSQSRLLAFVSVAAFVSYPIRDCTHYWILCSSVALSLAFYLGSLCLSMRAVTNRKPALYWLAAVPFALSIFNYEVFLPFAAVSALSVLFICLRSMPFVPAIKQTAHCVAPLALTVFTLVIYQRLIVPRLGLGYLHQVTIDPGQILKIIGSGTYVSSPLNAFPFLQQQVGYRLAEPFSIGAILSLLAIFAGVFYFSFKLLKKEAADIKPARLFELVCVGGLAIVSSIAIFGLNTEYHPTLLTLVNRMFSGAAVGWGMIFAAAALGAAHLVSKKRLAVAAISAVLSGGILFFTLANWQLAQAWVVSHRVQEGLFYLVKQQKGKLRHPDTIVLTECPRYVMWSPVFDGIWDFQSMVRLALDDARIRAGVVSERLVLGRREMKDVSMGYTCAVYPYEHLKVFIPSRKAFVPAQSGQAFLNVIENSGATIMEKGAFERWRLELAKAAN
jgi:hypothetical protein